MSIGSFEKLMEFSIFAMELVLIYELDLFKEHTYDC